LLSLATPAPSRAADPALTRSDPESSLPFRVLWKVELGGVAQMPIIHQGVVYAPWENGVLSAIDLHTGTVLRTATNVAYATAPCIVGNRIWSYNVSYLTELDLQSFAVLRQIRTATQYYVENIPYDPDTECVFLRECSASYKTLLTALHLPTGLVRWRRPLGLGDVSDNFTSALLTGDDSVYIQNADSLNHLYRIDKLSGAVRAVTDLTPGRRTEFNNLVYDRGRDRFYASSIHGVVFAIRRSDGHLLWSSAPAPAAEVRSTLTCYEGTVYVPLFKYPGPGLYAALDADTGDIRWIQEGFFNENGWSATAVDSRYLYRNTHGANYLIVQDRHTGELVWSGDAGGPASCANPVASDGVVVFGNGQFLVALQSAPGLPVNAPWHGVDATGFNPGAIAWEPADLHPDLDDDQLPDPWEMAVFGTLQHRGDDDTDDGGVDNYHEYLAGTDPQTPGDSLETEITIEAEQTVIRFQSIRALGLGYTGLQRLYAVESTPRIASGTWSPIPNGVALRATGEHISVALPADAPKHFYRVKTWLETGP